MGTIEHRPTTFKLTENHLKLLRAAKTFWISEPFGAPAVDPNRPFGNRDAMRDIIRITGTPTSTYPKFDIDDPKSEIPDGIYNNLIQIYQQLDIALQIVLSTGKFEAGEYYWPEYWNGEWKPVKS